jgi:DNA repair exonuclease SbcCD ATPase subunit
MPEVQEFQLIQINSLLEFSFDFEDFEWMPISTLLKADQITNVKIKTFTTYQKLKSKLNELGQEREKLKIENLKMNKIIEDNNSLKNEIQNFEIIFEKMKQKLNNLTQIKLELEIENYKMKAILHENNEIKLKNESLKKKNKKLANVVATESNKKVEFKILAENGTAEIVELNEKIQDLKNTVENKSKKFEDLQNKLEIAKEFELQYKNLQKKFAPIESKLRAHEKIENDHTKAIDILYEAYKKQCSEINVLNEKLQKFKIEYQKKTNTMLDEWENAWTKQLDNMRADVEALFVTSLHGKDEQVNQKIQEQFYEIKKQYKSLNLKTSPTKFQETFLEKFIPKNEKVQTLISSKLIQDVIQKSSENHKK